MSFYKELSLWSVKTWVEIQIYSGWCSGISVSTLLMIFCLTLRHSVKLSNLYAACDLSMRKKKKISTSIFVCATLRTWPLKNVCASKVSESFRNRSSRITLSKLTRNVKPAQYHNFQWHLGPERYKFGHASDDMARHERLFHGSEMYWLAFIYRVNVWEKKR